MNDDDERIEAYMAGYGARLKGQPCPTDADGIDGWNDRVRDEQVLVRMPARPEGYYHQPLDGE